MMATSALPTANTASASEAGLVAFVGRILIAAIFLLSGFAKLTAPAATIGYIQAAGLPAKTKYMAYPPDSEANNAVKNMVAPMPTYLLCSRGYFFNVPICAPEQNQKKRVTFFINIIICLQTYMKRFKALNVTNNRLKYLPDNNYL